MKHLTSIISLALLFFSACTSYHQPDAVSNEKPAIYPDYTDITMPVNIAPMNFEIQKKGDAYQTEIGIVGQEAAILVQDDKPTVDIPLDDWKELLVQAAGKQVYFRISIEQQGKWTRYRDLINTVSTDSIDSYLVYRLLYPGYELWNEMGIYQRDLTSFEQSAVMENSNFDHQCINCHSFSQHSSDNMMVHIRGKQGGTIIYHNGHIEKIEPKPEGVKRGATYPAWHPHGRYIAFSSNEIQQFFHSAGTKPIEVSDLAADLMVYDIEKHQTFTDSIVYNDTYYETFPFWAPDGKTLYFCRAKAMDQHHRLDSIRYDLCSVRFNEQTGHLDSLKIIFPASEHGKSVSFPVVSPDGRYLMFTLSAYGNFSIWHPESDLWLLDMTTGAVRALSEVNSNNVDSWHCWSSNGRWFTFSSKRGDGLWTRPYFAHFDSKTGRATKPFVLPQRDPRYYASFMYTYNRPELIQTKIDYGKMMEKAVAGEAIQAEQR